MLKSEQITKLSKSLILICLCFSVKAQVRENQIKQDKSQGSNAQIGSGNIIKSETNNKNDNRKYFKTENNSHSENTSVSGPLFTGNNPFVIVNNISPNRDSVNYEIQLKKKNIRIELAVLMFQGFELKNKCLNDTNYTKLTTEFLDWKKRTMDYLVASLDFGYAIQFGLAEPNDGLSFSSNPQANNLYNNIRPKIAKLDQFIASLY
jgi:hypothetical protein